MPDLLRPSDVDLRFLSSFILFYRIIQFQDRPGDSHGNNAVDDRQHHGHQQHQHNDEISHINHSVGKRRIRNHSHQLPAGITDRVHHDFPGFSLKGLVINAISVSRRRGAVLAADSVADLYPARMIDNLAVAVAEIIILAVVKIIDLIQHP